MVKSLFVLIISKIVLPQTQKYLFSHIDDPNDIFSKIISADILNKIVEVTNNYAHYNNVSLKQVNLKKTSRVFKLKNTNKEEI